LILGCSKGDFPTAKVEGVVLCEGKPVEAAAVYFEPLQAPGMKMIVGKQGFAFTDKDGKYKISLISLDKTMVRSSESIESGLAVAMRHAPAR
jgi:hypothetical protein